MIAQRPRATTTAYGTDDFAAHLAARETALGIAQTTQDVTQADHDRGELGVNPDGVRAGDCRSQAGDMGIRCDRWGNVITSAPRLDRAYTFTSRTWERGGRTVYVCGNPAAHVAAGHWQLDGRMSAGQGYVCARCFAAVARQWGIGREWRR